MDKLRQEVQDAEGGVLLATGERLREAAGESRLKEKARERVATRLQAVGLCAIPQVPNYQEHEVYVTSLTSKLSLMFTALHYPTQDNLTRHVLPAAGRVAVAGEKWDAVDELGELLDDAKELVEKIEGTSGT
jgi:hypothetical protein